MSRKKKQAPKKHKKWIRLEKRKFETKREISREKPCINPICPYYGETGSMVLSRIQGVNKKTELYQCLCCYKQYTGDRGTFFAGLRTDKKTVVMALKNLAEGNGIRGTARIMDTTKDVIRSWLIKAAQHVGEVEKVLTKELKFTRVQLDEIWSFVKKKTAITIKSAPGKHTG